MKNYKGHKIKTRASRSRGNIAGWYVWVDGGKRRFVHVLEKKVAVRLAVVAHERDLRVAEKIKPREASSFPLDAAPVNANDEKEGPSLVKRGANWMGEKLDVRPREFQECDLVFWTIDGRLGVRSYVRHGKGKRTVVTYLDVEDVIQLGLLLASHEKGDWPHAVWHFQEMKFGRDKGYPCERCRLAGSRPEMPGRSLG